MMSETRFKLRSEHDSPEFAGTVQLFDTSTYDVGQALKDGGGVITIVMPDPLGPDAPEDEREKVAVQAREAENLIAVLDAYGPLKRTSDEGKTTTTSSAAPSGKGK